MKLINKNTFLLLVTNYIIKYFTVIVAVFFLLYVTRIVESFKYPQRLQIFASWTMTIIMSIVFLIKKNLHIKQNQFTNYFLYYIIAYLVVGFAKLCIHPSSLFPINQADALFSLSLLLGIIFYGRQNFLRGVSSLYFKYIIPFFVLLLPFALYLNYADILGMNLFFFLLYPYLNTKRKFIVILVFILSILTTEQRIYYMRYFFCIMLLMMFYVPFLSRRLFAITHTFVFCIPLLALILALRYDFNVFDMKSYMGEGFEYYDETNDRTANVLEDSRTFIYLEAIESAFNNGYVIWGRTPYYGHESLFQIDRMSSLGFFLKGTSMERISEVHIESIFTWFGTFGLIFYMLMLYKMSINCIVVSNNKFCKIVGLVVPFMWLMLWIEYSFAFTPSYFVFPMVLGLTYNTDLYKMSDQEIKNYFYKTINQ